MKRMSIAEQTLKKQINRVEIDIECLKGDKAKIDAQLEILILQQKALQSEFDRLKAARELSSDRQAAANDR